MRYIGVAPTRRAVVAPAAPRYLEDEEKMSTNQWLAIDSATSPVDRAREVRREWEQFLDDGDVDSVRAPIAHSWQRSHAAGVDPSREHRAPVAADEDETSERWGVHPLAAASDLIRDCLAPIADAAAHLIVVSDADGLLLWIDGNARIRLDAADVMNFTEGAMWSEGGAGTNAIGTALAADHAVQVFAAEHFNEVVQEWTCAAAPVHDPDTGRLLGIIDLTGRMKTVHPHSFGLAVATAQAVESFMRVLMQEQDNRLRSRFAERLGGRGGRRALVAPSGRILAHTPDGWLAADRLVLPAGGGELVLPSGIHAFAEVVGHEEAFVLREVDGTRRAGRPRLLKLRLLARDHADAEMDGKALHLTRRQSEVLSLLAERPDGMTSEELAADVYGDAGQPGTARVEVYRLRKLLRHGIDTERYRLTMEVESDVARIRGLLDRGEVRAAAERYEGPLLPHSDAPGVVLAREALETWLRQAVMTADDTGALWAWVQCPSGRDDLLAWKRLLSELDYEDPRRSLAASQVGALRAAYRG
ncbi:MAG: putative phytochrome sensor protein [Solirubrobacterales bacterium]|nr:putative phytochrome sensor protein [Solirubrobacterales bacterium]